MVSTVQRVRKSGNSLVVTVPADIVEMLGITEGMTIRYTPEVVEVEYKSIMQPEWKASSERVTKKHGKSLRYLADK